MPKRNRETIQRPRGKDRQYNAQEEKTDNTMTKRKRQTIQLPKGKDRQCNDHLLVIVLSVCSSWALYCLSFPLGHCIVYLVLLVIVLSVFSSWSRGKDRQYNDQEEKTDNTMTKRKRQTIQLPKGKDRQCNDQEEKTDNTMTKRKRQTTQ
jgi:Flp pilus assembly protein TadB